MARRTGGIRGFGLICLLLGGCASTYLTERSSTLDVEEETPRREIARTDEMETSSEVKTESNGLQPEWHHVVYRGRVDWDGIFEGPITQATVSVYDGGERLHSTLTDSEGRFELPVDLFGRPRSDWKGTKSWRPDDYYSIVAQSRSGGFVKEELQKVDPNGFVHLEITPP